MPSRLLIVDDEPSSLATMAPLLRSRGYDVRYVPGATAVDVVVGTISACHGAISLLRIGAPRGGPPD